MTIICDVIYILALVVLSPYLIYRSLMTGKYRRGLLRKLTGRVLPNHLQRNHDRVIWFHGVSVGEIHLLTTIIAAFRNRHPDWQCIVSTTTDTGYDEAVNRFSDLPVVYWPFDFSWAVRRALRLIQPRVVVLAESEVWPNFMRIAKGQGVAVALVNGRMSPGSAKRFRRVRWLVRGTFSRLDVCGVQTEETAEQFAALGVGRESIFVTGSVKYDGAECSRQNEKTLAMRRMLQLKPHELVWVAGSTQAPEEKIVLTIYNEIRDRFPNLRLIIVSRHKERFDEVASLLEKSGMSFVRRSDLAHGEVDLQHDPVILIDTIGELSAVWGLADVAYVGGSLDGKRGGQNMIEPAAYGAAVIVGPYTWNFRHTVRLLLDQQALIQINDAGELKEQILRLVDDAQERTRLGEAAQRLVKSQQGATERTLDALEKCIEPRTSVRYAA